MQKVWRYNESEIDARLSIKVTQYHAVFGKDKLHQNSLMIVQVSELSLKLNVR